MFMKITFFLDRRYPDRATARTCTVSPRHSAFIRFENTALLRGTLVPAVLDSDFKSGAHRRGPGAFLVTKRGGGTMVGRIQVQVLWFRGWQYFLLALIGFLAACSSASAQTATGRIIGTVTDAQGAAIGGAKITV